MAQCRPCGLPLPQAVGSGRGWDLEGHSGLWSPPAGVALVVAVVVIVVVLCALSASLFLTGALGRLTLVRSRSVG